MRIELAYQPRAWQRECHKRRRRFTVLAVHRRAGKTELALMELIKGALTCGLRLPTFAYIAPFLKQAKAIAWLRLKALLEPLRRQNVVSINEGELFVRFNHNGALIRIFGGDNPDALRGMELDGVCLDEVAQMEPYVWQDIVQPQLANRLGWAMFIGTPHGINLFSELFFAAQKLKGWHAARYTVYDTNTIDPAEIERMRDPQMMSENTFAREWLCDFAAGGDDQLISLFEAESAGQRLYQINDIGLAARILSCDPARFGDDRSVIVRRQGLQMFPPIIFRKIDNMRLASVMAHHIEEWQPDGVFVDSGAGAGVIDRLRQLGYKVTEVQFGAKASKEHLYINRRTEMWCEMAEWIKQGGAIPNDHVLKQEIATPIYWFDNRGRKVLEPKDDIKERLQDGASPDIADALALTFAMPVRARERTGITQIDRMIAREDDATTVGHNPLDLVRRPR